MWRPKDWEETVNEKCGGRGNDAFQYQADVFFEAGADAMLEALLNDKSATPIEARDNATTVIFPPKVKGTVVFIPDDKV